MAIFSECGDEKGVDDMGRAISGWISQKEDATSSPNPKYRPTDEPSNSQLDKERGQ
jgi:hypothetical protein